MKYLLCSPGASEEDYINMPKVTLEGAYAIYVIFIDFPVLLAL
jgi:hypothetical protein